MSAVRPEAVKLGMRARSPGPGHGCQGCVASGGLRIEIAVKETSWVLRGELSLEISPPLLDSAQRCLDHVSNSGLFLRNTSGTSSAWCSNLWRPLSTSTKWGWLFRSTPSVSSRRSSRKESSTTAATGRARAGMAEGPPTQCLLVAAASPAGSPPAFCCSRQPADRRSGAPRVPEPGGRDALLLLLTLTGSCYCPIVVDCGLVPTVLTRHGSVGSVPCGTMDVSWLSWVLWAKPPWDLPKWVARQTSFKWLSSGFLFHQNVLFIFIFLSCGWLYPKKSILNYFIVSFSFPLVWVRIFI